MSTDCEVKAVCSACDRSCKSGFKVGTEDVKVPKGWKLIGGSLLCKDCKEDRYVQRAKHLPVASVVVGYDPAPGSWTVEASKQGWKSFRAALRSSWTAAARLYNWALIEFAKTDSEPLQPSKSGTGLVPGKWDRKSAVRQVRSLVKSRWPDIDSQIDSQSRYCVLAKAEGDYFRSRFERQVLCRQTLPETLGGRLPLPVPIAHVHSIVVREKSVFVSLRIQGAGEDNEKGRFTLRMRGGRDHWHAVESIEKALSGDGLIQELSIRESGDDVMVAFPLLLPPQSVEGGHVLVLTTDPGALLVAEVDRRPAWVLNADHLKRLLACHEQHERDRQRLSQDTKAGRRLRRYDRGSGRVIGIQERVDLLCEKHRRRMVDELHKLASEVVKFAIGRHCGEFFYLDRDKGFLKKFPWFDLHNKIQQKCAAARISFYSESGAEVVAVPNEEGGGSSELSGNEEESRWLRVTHLREIAHRRIQAGKSRKGSHPSVS